MMASRWQPQVASVASETAPETATGASVVGFTMGMSGAAAPRTSMVQPTMTASQYVATLSRDFRALPTAPEDDGTVDFDPDL
jgi:hypothetical protein